MEKKLRIWICTTLALITICDCASHYVPKDIIHSINCVFYNHTVCMNSNGQTGCGNETQTCTPAESDKSSYCYATWKNDSQINLLQLTFKGCLFNNNECYGQKQCKDNTEVIKFHKQLFCCCDKDYCNTDIFWDPIPRTPRINSSTKPIHDDDQIFNTVIYCFIPLVILIIMFLFIYMAYKRKQIPQISHVSSFDSSHLGNSSPILNNRPIELVEVKAHGCYGVVWKALHKKDTVAVKIFPPQRKNTWLVERDIYQFSHMQHENILSFIGAETHTSFIENVINEYWLITEYHDNGSLYSYLKSNTLTYDQLCHIVHSMTRGLMHLHDEIHSEFSDQYKPAIAHRDLKSNNILLKCDLTACISDFGLALVFHPSKPCGDTHAQVGTRRYMAPEVLEGAIHFSKDSFLRIDMYAYGLVLWELATRCTAQQAPIPDYKLPFEEEVGQHPSLEDMQEYVVYKKLRPAFKDTWKSHPGLINLCKTMEECWDDDAEARLSASCVVERIAWQLRQYNTTAMH